MIWTELLRDLVLCAAFALLLWAPLGCWIVCRLGEKKAWTATPLYVALGMGAWALWILLLGVFGILYKSSVITSGIILFAVLRFDRCLQLRKNKGSRLHFEAGQFIFVIILAGIAFFYWLLILPSAFTPELAFDALNVHLPYARDAAAIHQAGFVRNNWSSLMPALPLMTYITAFLFSGLALAKLFNVLCYLICGGIIYWFARRWWGPLHAIAASLLFWSCPVALYEATTTLIDLPLALFSAIALLSLLEWTRQENSAFFWLSAISLGLALGCKYHAGFWIFPLLTIIFWHTCRERLQGIRRALSLAFRHSAVAFLIFLPWLVRSYVYTGNPIFPVANGIFKSALFPPAMDAAAHAVYVNQRESFSFLEILKLPWTVSFHPASFHGTLGAIFFIGIIFALVRGKTPLMRYGLFCAFAHFSSWALTAQEIRYLLPLLPLLAILTSAGFLGSEPSKPIENENARNSSRAKQLGYYAGLVTIFAGSCMAFPPLYPKLIRDWTYWHSYKSPFPYLLGHETKEAFLQRDVPSIFVYDFVNRNLGKSDRVFLLNDAAQFYSEVPTLYSFTVDGDSVLLQNTEKGVIERLKQLQITHVLLNYNGLSPVPGVEPRPGAYFFLDKSFRERYLAPLFSKNNVVLYRVDFE